MERVRLTPSDCLVRGGRGDNPRGMTGLVFGLDLASIPPEKKATIPPRIMKSSPNMSFGRRWTVAMNERSDATGLVRSIRPAANAIPVAEVQIATASSATPQNLRNFIHPPGVKERGIRELSGCNLLL